MRQTAQVELFKVQDGSLGREFGEVEPAHNIITLRAEHFWNSVGKLSRYRGNIQAWPEK